MNEWMNDSLLSGSLHYNGLRNLSIYSQGLQYHILQLHAYMVYSNTTYNATLWWIINSIRYHRYHANTTAPA